LSNHFQETQDGVPVQPVSLSVLRIEQPSIRHWIARAAASSLVRMVQEAIALGLAEGNFAGIAAPALDSTLAVGTNLLQVSCLHRVQVMAFLRLISAGKSHILILGLECGLPAFWISRNLFKQEAGADC